MKRKVLIGLQVFGALVIIAFALRVYFAFYPANALVLQDPTHKRFTVDFVRDGFVDLSYHFRAHDFRVNHLGPVLIGDLYWETKYCPGRLYWSRDGTIAAASIVPYAATGEVFACAYDFRERHALRSEAVGFPLNDGKDSEIRSLVESRGGLNPNPIELDALH